MKASELIKAEHITAETIGENCLKITTEDGWRLKVVAVSETVNEDGETEKHETVHYAAEIFCAADAELPDYEVVQDTAVDNTDLADMSLEDAKTALLAKIAAYDESAAVNSFLLNGQALWLDKSTRIALMNSATVSKNMGVETVTLWHGEMSLTLPTEVAIAKLSEVEMYAQECFNVTSKRKYDVARLQTVEECVAYDYTQGYPERLEYDLTKLYNAQ